LKVSDNILVLLILVCISWSYNTFTLYTAFVDFTKAFDYLVRDVIWHKLIKYGVRGKIMDIINSMYENVRSRVKCNNTLSDDYSCCFFGGQTRGITVSILIQYVLQ